MTTTLTVIFTVAGFAIGSFLNVCIDRLPVNKSLLSPPSHCDSCRRRLSALDLVPLLSYLWLRGRCRYCGARIPLRVPLVELLTGALFFLAFWYFGLSVQFGITAFWCCVFLIIIFIDWEHQLILDKVTFPMVVLALVLLAFDSLSRVSLTPSNLSFLPLDKPSILSGVIGGAVGSGFFFLTFIIYLLLFHLEGMGLGDVKLAALIGLVTGWPMVIVALLIGILIGGLTAAALLAFRIKGRKDAIPYGTFLALGPIITLFWGMDIFHWYQNLFGFHII